MRVKWIDRWRGVLITLVVLGHIVGEGYHYANEDIRWCFDLWHRVIYSFHMPAFFFLAGLVWSARNLKFRQYFANKFKRLMVPYFIWGLVSASIYIIASVFIHKLFAGATTNVYIGKGEVLWWMPFVSIAHAGGWPNGSGFQCNSVLWFLPSLFSVEILYFMLNRFLSGRFWQIIIGIACVPMHLFVLQHWQNLPWGLGSVTMYLPFFMVGHSCKLLLSRDCGVKIKYIPWLILFVCLYCLICYIMPNRSISRQSVIWAALFCLLSFAGVALSAIVSIAMKNVYLENIGKASLTIMLSHKFVLIVFLNLIPVAITFRYIGFFLSAVICIAVTSFSLALSYCLGLSLLP